MFFALSSLTAPDCADAARELALDGVLVHIFVISQTSTSQMCMKNCMVVYNYRHSAQVKVQSRRYI